VVASEKCAEFHAASIKREVFRLQYCIALLKGASLRYVHDTGGRRRSGDAQLPINASLDIYLDFHWAPSPHTKEILRALFSLEYDGQESGFVLYQSWLIILHLQQLQELTIDKKLPTRVYPFEE
jgi:hypothetical protein